MNYPNRRVVLQIDLNLCGATDVRLVVGVVRLLIVQELS